MASYIGWWILLSASSISLALSPADSPSAGRSPPIAHSTVIGAGTVIGQVSHIVVIENGQGPATEDCPNFRVAATELLQFLRHAVLITAGQEHDWFLHGPCYARGTLVTHYGSWRWQLRNMGTATFTAVTGETFILADPRQESSLREE